MNLQLASLSKALISSSVLLFTGLAQGATYYVSTTGSDSNPGTQSAPFRHVSHGAAAAHAGDTVVVMDGTYDNEGQVANSSGGGSVVTVTNAGTAGNPITIMAQNRGGAILNAASSVQSSLGCYGAWAYFDVSYTSYVVIQGFVIENACINGFHANGNAHDITFRWNEIRNIGNWNNPASTWSPSGILIPSNEYNFTFDGNIFHDIGGGTNINMQHAIYSGSSNLTIVNNIFYNQVHGWDIQTDGGTNIYIANNTFAFPNPSRSGHIILWDGGVTNSLSNVILENNIFYQPGTAYGPYAIVTELDGGGSINGCTIRYNLTTVSSIYDNVTSCSQSSNVTSTDPSLTNTTTAPYDFHLRAGSPAIDTGMTVAYTSVDMDNWARPVNNVFDRGSYEYHSGSSGGGSSSITMSANPASLSVTAGGSATSSVTATVSGSASPAFSASGLPSGVTASFSPSSCTGSCNTTLTLTASGSAQGSSMATLAGTSGSTSGTASVAVTVNSSSVSLSANPTSLSVVQGGIAVDSISLSLTGSGSPSFSASGLPSGVTAAFSPSSCSSSCVSTMTLTATGTYQGSTTITVTAAGGTLSASTNVALTVSPSGGSVTGNYTTGLVGEWKLLGNTTDSVNGDNGTLNGGGAWYTGTINGVSFNRLSLNGFSAYMSVPERSQLETTSQMTVSAWVYHTQTGQSATDTDPRVVSKVYDWDVKLNGNLFPQFTANGQYAEMNYALPLSTWTQVVFTFAGGAVQGYVNGQPVSLSANTFISNTTLPANPNGLYIGTDSSLSAFYAGGLSDIRIYNRALSATDVSALYLAGTSAILGNTGSSGGTTCKRHCN